MSSFWQFFDSQMAIFRRVSIRPEWFHLPTDTHDTMSSTSSGEVVPARAGRVASPVQEDSVSSTGRPGVALEGGVLKHQDEDTVTETRVVGVTTTGVLRKRSFKVNITSLASLGLKSI